MPTLTITTPQGEMPSVDDHALPDNYASVARNCDFRDGTIRPGKAPLDLATVLLANTQTLYWYNKEANGGAGYWFQFPSGVDVIRGSIPKDSLLRTYIFGDGVPKITTTTLAQQGVGPYPAASHDLGIPAPTAMAAAGPAGEAPEGTEELRTVYALIYISDKGEEGPLGNASNIVTRWDTGTVVLNNIPVPSGNFNIVTKRIYRSESGSEYQTVAEIPVAQTTYNDSVTSEQLGSVVVSADWISPDPAMSGAIELPNGGMMGWYGHTLAFCEPYQHHAWPIRYEIALSDDVVGAAVSTAGIVIGTKSLPVLVVGDGSDPSSFSEVKMDEVQACVSKRSMVDMGPYVIYASPDGLVAVGGAEAKLITERIMRPEQWKSYSPESIHAYRFDDRYLGFYDNGTTQGSFLFHPAQGFTFYDEYADAGFVDHETGRLYLKQGTSLTAWWEGADMITQWHSKRWHTPDNIHAKCCKIDSDNYPLTVEFYKDDQLVKTKVVSNSKAFRIPSRSRYRENQIRLSSANGVNKIQLSTNMSELT